MRRLDQIPQEYIERRRTRLFIGRNGESRPIGALNSINGPDETAGEWIVTDKFRLSDRDLTREMRPRVEAL